MPATPDPNAVGEPRPARLGARLFERLPRPDGTRGWTLAKAQDPENKVEFEAYLARRKSQDRDLWIIELTVAEGEQFILNLGEAENKPRFMG